MHDDDDLDQRIARLQRLAYGADASDADRAEAAAELAALRTGGGDDDADGPPLTPAPSAASDDGRPVEADRADRSGADRTGRPTRWGLRRVLASSSAALIVGVAIGWGVGGAIPPSEGADVGVPVTETAAWDVFDRPATDGDFVRHPPPLIDIDADDSTRRLLLTRSDGVRLVAVRTADGENACLILALPVGRPATACTTEGRFPREGLRAEISVQGVGVYLAGWTPDGRAEVNAASAPTG